VRFAIEGGAVRVGGSPPPRGASSGVARSSSLRPSRKGRTGSPSLPICPGRPSSTKTPTSPFLCKPHDAHTEPQRPLEAGTLSGYLRRLHPEVAEIAPVPGLTLLTRLDFPTSGAVPAALTAQAWAFLRHEREMGRIGKRYLCLVEGEVPEPIRSTIG